MTRHQMEGAKQLHPACRHARHNRFTLDLLTFAALQGHKYVQQCRLHNYSKSLICVWFMSARQTSFTKSFHFTYCYHLTVVSLSLTLYNRDRGQGHFTAKNSEHKTDRKVMLHTAEGAASMYVAFFELSRGFSEEIV